MVIFKVDNLKHTAVKISANQTVSQVYCNILFQNRTMSFAKKTFNDSIKVDGLVKSPQTDGTVISSRCKARAS